MGNEPIIRKFQFFSIVLLGAMSAAHSVIAQDLGGKWYGLVEAYSFSDPRRVLTITVDAGKASCTWDEVGKTRSYPAPCSIVKNQITLTTGSGSKVSLTREADALRGTFTLKNGQAFTVSMGRDAALVAQKASPAETANREPEPIGEVGGNVVSTFHGVVSSTGNTWATIEVGSTRVVVGSLQQVRAKAGDVIDSGTLIGISQTGRRATVSVCLNPRACNGAPSEWPQEVRGSYVQLEQISLNLRALKVCEQTIDYAIVPPAANMAENLRAFSGVWVGKWDIGLCSAIIVENVQPDGGANILYVTGSQGSSGIKAGRYRYSAKIVGDTLTAVGGSTTIEFVMSRSAKLSGKFTNQYGLSSGVFERK